MKDNYIKLINSYLPNLNEDNLFKILTLVRNTAVDVPPIVTDKELIEREREKFKVKVGERSQGAAKTDHVCVAMEICEQIKLAGYDYSSFLENNGKNTKIIFGDKYFSVDVLVFPQDDKCGLTPEVNVRWYDKKKSEWHSMLSTEVTDFDSFVRWFDDFI
jgi:hypothetical protein